MDPTVVYDDASLAATRQSIAAAKGAGMALLGKVSGVGKCLSVIKGGLAFARGLQAGNEGLAFATAVNMSVREYLAGAFLYLYGLTPSGMTSMDKVG